MKPPLINLFLFFTFPIIWKLHLVFPRHACSINVFIHRRKNINKAAESFRLTVITEIKLFREIKKTVIHEINFSNLRNENAVIYEIKIFKLRNTVIHEINICNSRNKYL